MKFMLSLLLAGFTLGVMTGANAAEKQTPMKKIEYPAIKQDQTGNSDPAMEQLFDRAEALVNDVLGGTDVSIEIDEHHDLVITFRVMNGKEHQRDAMMRFLHVVEAYDKHEQMSGGTEFSESDPRSLCVFPPDDHQELVVACRFMPAAPVTPAPPSPPARISSGTQFANNN
jgi:hypothetical protein